MCIRKIPIIIFVLTIWLNYSLHAQFSGIKFKQISQENGLPGVTVRKIFQDSKGIMWFGVESYGLCKYDGYNFELYNHTPDDSTSLGNSVVESMLEDDYGNLWIGTQNGLCIFDRASKKFRTINKKRNSDKHISGNVVLSLLKDNNGNIWLGTDNGITVYSRKTKTFTQLISSESQKISINDISVDYKNNIWCASNHGIYYIYKDEKKYNIINIESNSISNFSSIECISDSTLLVGAQMNLYNYNILTKKWIKIKFIDKTLENSGDYITDILKDQNNNIWISSTTDGISIVSTDWNTYKNYKPDFQNPNGIKSSAVRDIFEDRKGQIWLGLKMEGLQIFNYQNQTFNTYIDKNEDSQILNSSIISLYYSKDDKVLIGSGKNGLLVSEVGSKKIKRINFSGYPELNNARINSIYQDYNSDIWIATATSLFKCNKNFTIVTKILKENCTKILTDRKKNVWIGTQKGIFINSNNKNFTFAEYFIQDSTKLIYEIKTLFEDSKGNVWIGTLVDGLFRFDSNKNKVISFSNSKNRNHSMTSKHIRFIYEDKQGFIWITTRGDGLYKYSYKDESFQNITEKDGLPTNTLFGIQEDSLKNLWISSYQGLFSYNYTTKKIVNFTKEYGLLNDIFEPNACCNTKQNLMYFGGENGINFFNPYKINVHKKSSPLIITSIKVFNNELYTDIDSSLQFKLSYTQNNISFEFALLDYSTNIGKSYTYILNGVDEDWITTKSRNFVSYSNLSPGKYKFFIKGQTKDGVFNDNSIVINFTILAPFWQKLWFQIIVILLILFIVYIYAYTKIRKEQKRNKQLEYLVNKKTEDLQNQKTELIQQKKELEIQTIEVNTKNDELKNSNITKNTIMSVIAHDLKNQFQSLLNLSSSVVHEAQEKNDNSLVLKSKQMNITAKSSLNILDNLLNWYKSQNNELKANLSDIELRSIIIEIVNNYTLSLTEKHIEVLIDIKNNESIVADIEMLRVVVRNLLNNAIKYTKNNGKIKFVTNSNDKYISLSIIDDGVGMDQYKLETLFLFNTTLPTYNKGLGLQICKKFCNEMNIEIAVQSELNSGTTFSLYFQKSEPKEYRALDHEIVSIINEFDERKFNENFHFLKQKKILIIDDNKTLLEHMDVLLSKYSIVYRAENGKLGLDNVFLVKPDLIITDFMMPEINGIELTRIIRNTEGYKHIPILMLTGQNFDSIIENAYLAGISDCITKPFDEKIFLIKIINVLKLRSEIEYMAQISISAEQDTEYEAPQSLVKTIINHINSHEDFNEITVESLAYNLNMSKSTLIRKLKNETTKSPSEIINDIKFEKAKKMLENGNKSISEIAWSLGFTEVKYFRKRFKTQFGVSPSQFKKDQNDINENPEN